MLCLVIMDNLTFFPIKELHKRLTEQSVTSRMLVEASFAAIEQFDSQIRAFVHVEKEKALQKADAIDTRFAAGEELPMLAGIPFSVKDAFNVKDGPTRSASKVLEGYTSPYTATAIQKLIDAGAIYIGKNNQDAFGFGASTENSDYGTVRNPWNSAMVAGGSSGGSAAAVALGMGVFAIGEDTGGSIRLPANFCGVTGLKVTYGRVSRYGAIAFSSSLDTIGPITHSVEDAALIMEIIAGKDERDATTLTQDVPHYSEVLGQRDLSTLRVGIVDEMVNAELDSEISEALAQTKKQLEDLGATFVSVSMPFSAYGVGSYYIMAPSEASSNLSRYDGIRYGASARTAGNLLDLYKDTRTEGFNQEVMRRVMLGTYALSSGYYDAYFKKAQQIRTLMKEEFENVFSQVDVILAPVAPTLPFEIGKKSDNPLEMYLVDVFTIPVNIAGVPSLSLPAGISSSGLPIGLQVVGPQLSESLLLQIGHAFQQKTDWHKKQPKRAKF